MKNPPLSNDALNEGLKRHKLLPRQLVACFPASESATYSSSICSCLGIPTPTITTTFYFTQPASATQIVTVTTSPPANPAIGSLSTVTITSGSVGFTSTVPTTVNGVATQVVYVVIPTPSTITVTSGSVGYTSTVSTTIDGAATQVVVVAIPTPSTITITSGSIAYTSIVPTTIDGAATQVAVVVVPTPSTITITSGTIAFTSTVPTTIAGAATQVVVIVVPTPPASTITFTSGSVAYTSTVPTTIDGIATQVAVVAVPTPSCTATGLAYTAYYNPFIYNTGASTANPFYTNFDSTYFNGLPISSALYSGITNKISFALTSNTGTLYGTVRTINQTAIVYTGYFSPPVSGIYRLGLSSADDIAYLWMGAPASSGTWGESNWNVRSTFGVPTTATVSQNFIAGQLYPIVVLYADGSREGRLIFSITTPAGLTISDTTGYFLQPSCATSGLTLGDTQPSISSCPATGIEYINRPAPTATVDSTGAAVALPYSPNNYNPPTASPYSTINFQGITNRVAFTAPFPATSVRLYGYGPYNMTQSVTLLRGYFVANLTGPWTFTINRVDDTGYMWLGPNAVSSWTSANAQITNATFLGPPVIYTTTLTAGSLTPIRLAYDNQGGGLNFTLAITNPLGVTTLDTTGYLQQKACGPDSGWT